MSKFGCVAGFFLAGVAGCIGQDTDGADDEATVTAAQGQEQFYEIVAQHSLKCIDVAHASVAHAAPVVQADCWGGGNQKWFLRGSGYVEIVVQHSRKCLDVAHLSQDHGAPIVQGDCWGGPNQKWRLNPVGTAGSSTVYEIIASHSGKCLDVANASLAHGAAVIQGTCWGGTNQHFILRPINP